ncbi:MAG: hypothetical protein GW802_27605 [Armatimonadetes bacterium]|nr:hypothetical protein [Armatimonadota bacterium]
MPDDLLALQVAKPLVNARPRCLRDARPAVIGGPLLQLDWRPTLRDAPPEVCGA